MSSSAVNSLPPPPYVETPGSSHFEEVKVQPVLNKSDPPQISIDPPVVPPPLPLYPEDRYAAYSVRQDFITDKKLIFRYPGTLLSLFLVMSGIDMAWSIFTFCWVISTWLLSVGCLVLPCLGLPIYGLFALSWRALARLEVIYMSFIIDTKKPKRSEVVFYPLFPQPTESSVPQQYNGFTRPPTSQTIPVVTPASHAYQTLGGRKDIPKSFFRRSLILMFSKETWHAVVYFSFIRFVLSVCTYMIAWVVFFPIWILWGICCCGFFLFGIDGGWWMVYPIIELQAAQRRIAFDMLLE
ncbi:hypothetical protein HK098_007359 [Nowakowskiella sp. JEL0407]|nr:hypothetical protein HK098_007359 [Nowakowskiella sp. JEL0407]